MEQIFQSGEIISEMKKAEPPHKTFFYLEDDLNQESGAYILTDKDIKKISLAELQKPEQTLYRDSSGGFEVIDWEEQQPEESDLKEYFYECSTVGGDIVATQVHEHKVLTPQEWEQFIQNPSSFLSVDIVNSMLKGLKPQVRLNIWNFFLSQMTLANDSMRLSMTSNKLYDCQIEESLKKLEDRCGHLEPKKSQLKQTLKIAQDILTYYYPQDPEVGYSRGMEYFAFGIALIAKQSPTFYDYRKDYFTYLMRKKNLRDMFFPGNPGIFSKTKQLELHIKQEIPEFHKLMEKYSLEYHNLFYKHYLTGLMLRLPVKELISPIMDLLMLEGHNFITYMLRRSIQVELKNILRMDAKTFNSFVTNDLFYKACTPDLPVVRSQSCSNSQPGLLEKFWNVTIRCEKVQQIAE